MNFISVVAQLLAESGFAALSWQQAVMILISFVLMYLAIKKQFEPLLLLPIAFGMLLANLPEAGLMYDATADGAAWYQSGIIRIMYSGVKSSLFPCLIFMCIGAMTDFGPLIANPISLLLGAAAQFGIYIAFIIANATGLFTPEQAAALDIPALARFLASPLAERIRTAPQVWREYRFALLTDAGIYDVAAAGEEMLLQGVADCVFETTAGLTVVDFKTDRVTAAEASQRAEAYRPQLDAYAGALSRILEKPVTERILYFFACGEEISL